MAAIMWRSLRTRRLMVLIISCLLLIFIKTYFYTFRHGDQILVNIGRWVHMSFVEEQPDVLNDPGGDGRDSGLCPKMPPGVDGKLHVPDLEGPGSTDPEVNQLPPIAPGGHYKPATCLSRTQTAIIVPYRQRERHLAAFIKHLVPFLIRQQAEFNIFVVEAMPGVAFNRALLLNVGFVEVLKIYNFSCFVFHDVDQLPESDLNLYRCGSAPRHMAAASSAFDYQLPYGRYAGGVIAMSRDIYEEVNGHSNLYFGWGGEDDDLLHRLSWKNYPLSRYPADIARYSAQQHKPDKGNGVSDVRYQLMWTSTKRMSVDGINSVKYRRVQYDKHKLYTRILVDYNMEDYEDAIFQFT